MERVGLNRFDGVIYINLAHRKDRKRKLLSELKRLGVYKDKIHRIEPPFDPLNGHRGCAMGHAKAIEYAASKNWTNALILEDDFFSTRSHHEIEPLLSHFFTTIENQWDVFLIGGNVKEFAPTPHDRILRVHSSQCAHAYAVNQHYFHTLRSLFLYCHQQMAGDPLFFQSVPKAIDQQWDYLMKQDRWYLIEVFGQQGPSYSDIDHMHRDRIHKERLS